MSNEVAVFRWSTEDVPSGQRLDYYADTLSSQIIPMEVECNQPRGFSSSIAALDLRGVSLLRQKGTAHRSFTNASTLARSSDRSFHLIVNLASEWTIDHRQRLLLRAGDAVLTDSRYVHDLTIKENYDVVHLKFSTAWLEQWVSDPDLLVGRRLPFDAKWGAALTAFVSCLSPDALVSSPLAKSAVVDQVGALMALMAHELGGTTTGRLDLALRRKIEDSITQLCPDQTLNASGVACSMALPEEVVHKTLAAAGVTFEWVLQATRARIAARMLASPLFSKVALAEIARRTGFANARQMRRAIRGPACIGERDFLRRR